MLGMFCLCRKSFFLLLSLGILYPLCDSKRAAKSRSKTPRSFNGVTSHSARDVSTSCSGMRFEHDLRLTSHVILGDFGRDSSVVISKPSSVCDIYTITLAFLGDTSSLSDTPVSAATTWIVNQVLPMSL